MNLLVDYFGQFHWHPIWNFALQIHLWRMRVFCLNVTTECSIGHFSLTIHHKIFSYTIKMSLLFIDTATSARHRVTNYIVKQSFICSWCSLILQDESLNYLMSTNYNRTVSVVNNIVTDRSHDGAPDRTQSPRAHDHHVRFHLLRRVH